MFLATLDISNGRFSRALNSQVRTEGTPIADKRGKHPPANKPLLTRLIMCDNILDVQ